MRSEDSGEDNKWGTFDRQIVLQKSTEETHANLIADIVGHPKGAPSVAELKHMNPSLNENEVRNHLRELRKEGIVEDLEFEPAKSARDFPYKFYRITKKARRLFDDNGLFPEEAWQRQYEDVEKTQDVRRIENMPRSTASTDETFAEE